MNDITTVDPDLRIVPEIEGFIFHTIVHRLAHPEKKLEVMEHVVTHGDTPPEFRRFMARLTVAIGKHPQTGQTICANGEIPIDAEDLTEAFEMLPGLIEETAPKIQQEARNAMARPKIAVPGQKFIERFSSNGSEFKLGPE